MSANSLPAVPRLLDRGAAIAWRVLVMAAALVALGFVARKLWVLVVALSAAVLATAVLGPVAEWLRSKRWPSTLAAAAAFVGGIIIVIATGFVVVPPLIAQAEDFSEAIRTGISEAENWLEEGVLGFSGDQVRQQVDSVTEAVKDDAGELGKRLFAGTLFATEMLVALILAFVITFFFLKDSERITAATLSFVQPEQRDDAREMGRRAWTSVSGYVRGSAVVGLIDASLIGLGLVILGVPLALPIMILTFFGAFFPILGAWVAGLVAAGIAGISLGLVYGLIVAGLAFAVQQIESNLLEPLVLGRAVSLHPVVILLVLTAGAIVGGILGAFLAVPISAVIGTIVEFKRGEAAPPRKRGAARRGG